MVAVLTVLHASAMGNITFSAHTPSLARQVAHQTRHEMHGGGDGRGGRRRISRRSAVAGGEST